MFSYIKNISFDSLGSTILIESKFYFEKIQMISKNFFKLIHPNFNSQNINPIQDMIPYIKANIKDKFDKITYLFHLQTENTSPELSTDAIRHIYALENILQKYLENEEVFLPEKAKLDLKDFFESFLSSQIPAQILKQMLQEAYTRNSTPYPSNSINFLRFLNLNKPQQNCPFIEEKDKKNTIDQFFSQLTLKMHNLDQAIDNNLIAKEQKLQPYEVTYFFSIKENLNHLRKLAVLLEHQKLEYLSNLLNSKFLHFGYLDTFDEIENISQNHLKQNLEQDKVYLFVWDKVLLLRAFDKKTERFANILENIFVSNYSHIGYLITNHNDNLCLSQLNSLRGFQTVETLHHIFESFSLALSLDISSLLPPSMSLNQKKELNNLFLTKLKNIASKKREEAKSSKAYFRFIKTQFLHTSYKSKELSDIKSELENNTIISVCSTYVIKAFLAALNDFNEESEFKIPHPFGTHENLEAMDIARFLFFLKELKISKPILPLPELQKIMVCCE